MKSSKLYLYGTLFIFLFSLISFSYAKTINVCPFDCRYSTIQKAVDDALTGDTILVQSGNYNENLNIKKSGLTLLSPKGSFPGIKGKKPGISTIKISSNKVSVIGFEITGCGNSAIKISGNDIGISDCNIHSLSNSALEYLILIDNKDKQISNISIQNCTLNGATKAAIQTGTEEKRWISGIFIIGCKIWNIESFIANSPHIWLDDLKIANNIICGLDKLSGKMFGQFRTAFDCSNMIVKNAIIANNLIYGWPGWAIFYKRSMNEAYSDIYIINNTIVKNGYGIFIASTGENQVPEQFTGKILNNIIAFNKGCGLRIYAPNQPRNHFNYNNLYGNNPNYLDIERSRNDIEMNPQFSDTSKHDYRLLAISPCIDKGMNILKFMNLGNHSSFDISSVKSIFDFDIDGIKRMLDGDGDNSEICDIGAFENYDNIFFNINKKLWLGNKLLSDEIELVKYNDNYIVKFEPGEKYNLNSILIDGVKLPFSSQNSSSNIYFSDTNFASYTFEKVRQNHTVDIILDIKKYRIVIASAEQGKIISPCEIFIDYGQDYTFDILCNEGYHISNVFTKHSSFLHSLFPSLINFSSYIQRLTIQNITASDSIYLNYEPNVYPIIVKKNGKGSIFPAEKMYALHGDNLHLKFIPDDGYHISSIMLNSKEIPLNTPFIKEEMKINDSNINTNSEVFTLYNNDGVELVLNNIKRKTIININFELNKYTIAAYCGKGGIITNFGINKIEHGRNIKFAIKPEPGYQISKVMANKGIINNELIFSGDTAFLNLSDIKEDDFLNIVFEPKIYTIAAEYHYDGIVEQKIIQKRMYGDSVTFSIEVRKGEHLSDVRTKTGSVFNKLKRENGNFTYTFKNISNDEFLNVEYNTEKYSINVEAQGNGTFKGADNFIARHGRNYSVVICPERGYKIANAYTSEKQIMDKLSFNGDTATYTFENVNNNEKLYVKFELKGVAEVWVKSSWESQLDIENDILNGLIPDNFLKTQIAKKITQLKSRASSNIDLKRPIIWGKNAFSSIMQAIESVAFNGKIFILNGNYCEQLIINKPLKIVGIGNPILTSPNISELIPYLDNKSIIYIDNLSSNVEISGIHIKGPSNHSIENYNGIFISGDVNFKLENATISPRHSPDLMTNSIIYSKNNYSSLINNSEIIGLDKFCNIEIKNCNFTGFTHSSIYVEKSICNIDIHGNSFSNPASKRALAIILKGGNDINIVDNSFSSDDELFTGCILLEKVNNSNPKNDNSLTGIDAFIAGNDISGFNTFGIKIDTRVSNVMITDNSIDGIIGLNNCSAYNILATNNWWGSENPVLGFSFSSNVNYKPYLTRKILHRNEIGMSQ